MKGIKVMSEEALAKVEQIYQNRSNRVKELKSEGTKIIGYFYGLTPVEIITAADLVPYRITGRIKETVSEADAYLEAIACPFTRNCLGLALQGEYDFLDGFVMPHNCDNSVKLYDIWKHNIKPAYAHFINIPHTRSQPAHEFFLAELMTLKRSIEKFIGREITEERLSEAIKLHNENRALIRQMYELRKEDPPLVLGSEVMKIISCILSLPVEESNKLLRQAIQEVKERKADPKKKLARLLIYGSELDSADFIEMVEANGADVVMDDLCFGYRSFAADVETTGNPLKNITDRYLDKLPYPRFYVDRVGTRQEDLEARFGYLQSYAEDFNVNGVVIQLIIYCDPYAFDLPDIKEFLIGAGLPVLAIEHDYTLMSIQRLKTQVQAFLEMIA